MDRELFIKECGRYLELGYSIIPCCNSYDKTKKEWTKKPLVKWKEFQTRWASIEEVTQWADTFNNANLNIGIITGGISNVVVVDFDTKETFEEYKEKYGLPYTPTVATGRGYHLYYKYPGFPINNSAGKIDDKVDFRGDGGFAVLPPSIHYSGREYLWEVCPEDAQPALLPEWVLKHYTPNYNNSNGATQEVDKSKNRGHSVSSEGSRNFDLYRLTQQLRRTGLPKNVTLASVGAYNAEMCSPPLDDTEITKIVDSAYKDGEIKTYPLSDAGNAERLSDKCIEIMRHVFEQDKWYVYSNGKWSVDKYGYVHKQSLELVRNIPLEINEDAPDAVRDKYIKFALSSESTKSLEAMKKQAKEFMAISSDKFDVDPWIFNVENGTIDLKTDTFREHRAVDMLTKMGDTMYDPDAKCSTWINFVNQLFGGDQTVIRYFQKALGYGITGSVKEQKFFVLIGGGGNGKSTMLEAVKNICGNYGMTSSFDTFTTKLQTGVRNDIARMVGIRMVTASETNPGKELDSSLIKTLTGGDTVAARFLFKEEFDFKPIVKIFLATNHKPKIKDDSEGMWRRMRCIPCTLKLDEKDKDLDLPSKLYAERSGILNWILEGCKLWKKEGLKDIDVIMAATNEYREEMDIFARFFNECCKADPDAKVSASDVYESFSRWARKYGETPWTSTMFGIKLRERGFEKIRGGKGNMWKGLRLDDDF